MDETFHRRSLRRGSLVFLHRFLPQHLFLGMRWSLVDRALWGAAARGVRLWITPRGLLCGDLRALDCESARCARRTLSRRRLGSLAADRGSLGHGERSDYLGHPPLSLRSITLACVGAPFFWVSLEVYRTWLPEISFPWNLLGY